MVAVIFDWNSKEGFGSEHRMAGFANRKSNKSVHAESTKQYPKSIDHRDLRMD